MQLGDLDLGLTPKSHGPPPTPPILTMMECSKKKKKFQKGNSLSMTLPTHPGGQQDQGHGVVLDDQGEGLQSRVTPTSGSSQVPQGLRLTLGGNDVF